MPRPSRTCGGPSNQWVWLSVRGFLQMFCRNHCPNVYCFVLWTYTPSVLWHCCLGGKKGIRPVKTEWWGAGAVICLEWDADLHMAQLMPLPLTVSYFSKIHIDFIFLVSAHPGSPGKRPLNGCLCVVLWTWDRQTDGRTDGSRSIA